MSEFFIGVDGGGTSCRAALATANGAVIGEGRSGAANIMTDVNGAVVHIVEAATKACRVAGVDPDNLSSSHAVLGLAGANVDATVTAARRQLPFRTCEIETDALIAAHGALGDGDGAIAVLGTGSVFAQKRGDIVKTIGGWGLILGDQGAGAALGRSVLREALLAFDGVRDGSELTYRALGDFNNDPRALSAFAHDAVPGQFARYAPLVFEYANRGDGVALRVLRGAAAEVDESLRVVLRGANDNLCLLGGLGPHYESWLAAEHQRCVRPAVADALSGATQLAIRRFSKDGCADG